MTIRRIDEEDLILWPDGTYCHYYELSEMSHKSDDFEVIPFDSIRYNEVLETT